MSRRTFYQTITGGPTGPGPPPTYADGPVHFQAVPCLRPPACSIHNHVGPPHINQRSPTSLSHVLFAPIYVTLIGVIHIMLNVTAELKEFH